MASDESDIEIRTVIKKTMKKAQQLPEDVIVKEQKKLSTKDMIQQALEQSKNRKGTSLQAIKKYIKENFNTDTEKINYLIKKTLNTGVETGIFVRTKGIGASGSFKLAPKSKEVKKEKPKTTEKLEGKSKEKTKKEVEKDKEKKLKKVVTEEPPKKLMKKIEEPTKKSMKKVEEPTKKSKVKLKEISPKPGTSKMTPVKRMKMMKRKSIGSIIKKPKMKPKAKG